MPQVAALRLGLQYVQLYGVPLFMDLQWPDALAEAFRNILRVFRFDFVDLGMPECAVKLPRLAVWGLGMAFPIVVLALLIVRRRKHDYNDPRRANMTRMMAQIVFFLPAGRVVAALKAVGCRSEDGPFAYMLDAYTDDVECGTTLHYVLLAVGLVLALLFGVGPVIWFLRRLGRKDQLDSDEVRARKGIIYSGMRPKYWRWELTVGWTYRVVSSILELRYIMPAMQAGVLLGIDILMLLLLIRLRPYNNRFDQRLSIVLQLVLIVLTILGILSYFGFLAGSAVTGLVVGLFIVMIFAVTYVWRKTRDSADLIDFGSAPAEEKPAADASLDLTVGIEQPEGPAPPPPEEEPPPLVPPPPVGIPSTPGNWKQELEKRDATIAQLQKEIEALRAGKLTSQLPGTVVD
jgi:hypothetical protein